MSGENKRTFLGDYYSSGTVLLTLLYGFSFWVFELLLLPETRKSAVFLSVHLSRGNYFRFFLVLTISILAFGLFLSFIYTAFASSYGYRIIYFLIFSILVLTEYGYYQALEYFFRFEELEIALYATNFDIVSNAALYYFNYLALIPVVIFGLLLIKSQPLFKQNWKPFLILMFLFVGFFSGTAYFTKNTYYVHSFNSGIRVLMSFPVIWYVGTINAPARSDRYYESREDVGYKANEKPVNNVVFIVDESVRSDHLSLNGYEISTTPSLEQLEKNGFIRNWGTAVSSTTCSVSSNALMLTGLRELHDTDYKIYKWPTIFQYAKAMNYRNYYIDGQLSTHWNGKVSDIPDYGEWITANELIENAGNKYDVDVEIARRVKKIVNGSKGNFIWINKHGIQITPVKLYPRDKESMTRKYDEAVRHNLEGFFRELLDDENFGKNAIYVYTSDHGWLLDETEATHCQNTKEEASVPIFMIASPENLPDADTRYKATHANLFATLLDLMKFPEKRKYDYAISLLEANESDSKKRFYFVGDLHNPEEGKRYPFDE